MRRGPGSGGSSGSSNAGQVYVELLETEYRSIHSDKLLAMWRAEAGEFPVQNELRFGSENMGPGGKAIEFKLLAPGKHVDQLLAATEETKQQLDAVRWCL